MLDIGFAPQINKIPAWSPGPPDPFPATMPEQIAEIAKLYMELLVRVEIARAPARPPRNVEHHHQDLYTSAR